VVDGDRGSGYRGRVVGGSNTRVRATSAGAARSPSGWRPLARTSCSTPGCHDVNVNAVAPGATRRSAAVVVDDGDAAAASLPPLGRINDPADIAGAVAYLVSPDARNVSGQLITVAGSLNPAL
jgi:NAD(P)-dependent dehydrogenase (short-subunit alcohol dehydrogenase family)